MSQSGSDKRVHSAACIRVSAVRGTYAASRPRFYDGPNFTAAESNRNGGISNCNVIRHERAREAGAEQEEEEEEEEVLVGRGRGWSGCRTGRKKKKEQRRKRGCRTKDKECGTQRVTRISFDGITWRLRAGTVIALVVYR